METLLSRRCLSFLGVDLAGRAALGLLRPGLARPDSLFTPAFLRRAARLAAARRRGRLRGGLLRLRLLLRGLLNYDVVLDVEFVVHVHNVYLHALPAWALSSRVRPLVLAALAALDAHRDDALHVEELLLVAIICN